MVWKGGEPARNGISTGLLIGGAVSLLALPSAVLAFSTGYEAGAPSAASAPIETLQRGTDAEFARAVPLRSLAKGQRYRFTPAGTPNRPDRSVTVAVRVDSDAARAITVRHPLARDRSETASSPLRIAPTAFSLGVSRGYEDIVQDLVPPKESKRAELPDLSKFRLSPGARPDESRFSPRIVLDEKQSAGRAPRTFSGDTEELVDVGGSYRVTRNLNVTAGVRYSQDRDRLRPLTDGKQDDSQAVYVGTQFKF
ncbi:hypothetical protein GCM10011371_16260 [Novosphingobium marinum]|uniref:Porin n=1 Tax=Novosphingobium marinum TaxID=1514948 RepID=A0A7Y9XWG9_9SPHN|nr:hypothetical protein [Novosphingobium marinum]NYH95740.1 hypothetical protein [Novosphingobium marinum]GGC29456.1 hypothetical protein GCM10011371_16260 [Novosphingobium marinum]